MTLAPGNRIGPYDVVGTLGEGGMGEVYRAHDARLKRDVALKVLAPAAAGDADRRARFEREAQVLASLNHPNVAHIFGVEMHGDAPVIVMELVEGATLAEPAARRQDDALCHLERRRMGGVAHRRARARSRAPDRGGREWRRLSLPTAATSRSA